MLLAESANLTAVVNPVLIIGMSIRLLPVEY